MIILVLIPLTLTQMKMKMKAMMRKMTTLIKMLVLAVNLQAKIYKRINVQRSMETMKEGREVK